MDIHIIDRILIQIKTAIKFNHILDYNSKNKETMLLLGYQEEDVFDELLKLRREDYSSGPIPDKDGYLPDYWVFGRTIQGLEIYIKVKIKNFDDNGDRQLSCYCKSFHMAEKPLTYPLKK